MNDFIDEKTRDKLKKRIKEILPSENKPLNKVITEAKTFISEAVYLIAKPFILKTEKLSTFTKDNHFSLYRSYIEALNQISPKIDTVNKVMDSLNPTNSEFRRLKLDEQSNFNGVKLHELYFSNISDLNSQIRADSLPFIRLSKDFGTFEQWQLDFRSCGMVALEGWAVCYFDPYSKKYTNCVIEKHSENIPVMGIPVIVVDTFHHAWFKDYSGDKKGYLNGTLQELNWSVIEQRMMIAERANLDQLYNIRPVQTSDISSLVGMSEPINKMPIEPVPSMPGSTPTLPPITTTQPPLVSIKEGKK
ncbi:MAG TPA: Fe-Mn family superoxide dismutase [Leptospiraceae bacterium]|nr:Fe-Mn family superoxide dismutase [Leptospiraceae bacterium]